MRAADLSRDLTALAGRLRASTVRVDDPQRGHGSGVVWNDDGLIATNAHVVRGASAAIGIGDGAPLRARTLERDEASDLALLLVDLGDLRRLRGAKRAADVRPARDLRAGELTFAIGHPLGLADALASGIVERCNARWVMSDVKLAPGNSGGPLADGEGRVVGINSMVAYGRGVAVPSERVVELAARLGGGAAAAPRRLGITLEPVLLAARGGARSRRALLVTNVARGSAAERSGLALGDVVLGSDRASAADPARLAETLPAAAVIDIVRAGIALQLALVWEAASNAPAA